MSGPPWPCWASGDDLLADVAYTAAAGHVLDFDDTFPDGVAHVSATTAPAALVLAAHLGLWLQATLDGYAEGFEAMAAVAAASHPALYDGGWHPTAVCGPIGAVVAASRLLGLSASQRENAVAVALLRAGATAAPSAPTARRSRSRWPPPRACRQRCWPEPGRRWIGARSTARSGSRRCSAPAGRRQPTKPRARLRNTSPPAHERSTGIGSSCIRAASARIRRSRPWRRRARAGHRLVRDGLERGGLDGHGPELEGLDVRVHPVARQAAHLDLVSDGLLREVLDPVLRRAHAPPRSSARPRLRRRRRRHSSRIHVW